MKWIEKNIGRIVLVVVFVAILAPIIFTLPGFECFNKTTTGQIGDTIGGTTAPFWGFLSVILLYITLKEQQKFNREQLNFNRAQQTASDYDILMRMRENISNLSNNLEVNINKGLAHPQKYTGASYIEELRNTMNPDNSISEDNFDKLYKSVVEIAELCLLYYELVKQSSLAVELKRSFFQAISIHSESINRLFYLYQQKNIKIIGTMASVEDDLFQRYAATNERFIKRFKEAQQL
ncbi:hypothetical protein NXV73_13860 [Bacteroides salyersiae]|nr:hypothetical protein [Bacteroides salyersiae]